MNKLSIVLSVFTFVLMVTPFANAQDLPEGTKYENVTWYTTNSVKFKPGKVDEALNIIYDHFVPAGKESGQEVISFDMRTGEWHHVVYFPMEDGASGLAWKNSPKDIEWWAELTKQLGGEKEAQDLMAQFNELIADSKSEIVMRRME
jgi:hypothetical protein